VSIEPTPVDDDDDDDFCDHCDGDGRIWNNADPTSGQWVECDQCEDGRIYK